MSLRPAFLLFLPVLLLPAGLAAGTVQLLLYAVEAGAADRFPPEVTATDAALAAHLQTMKDEGTAATPVEASSPFEWAKQTSFSQVEELEYFPIFTGSGETLKGEQSVIRSLGYETSFRALRLPDESARLQLSFTWTPTLAKVPIPKGGDNVWVPRFRTLKANISTSALAGQPALAATWRTALPLTPTDPGALRQLYLIVSWTADPTDQ